MPVCYLRHHVALVLVLLGLSPAAAVAQQASSNPYYDFLLARRLEADGNSEAALAALRRAAAADPNSAEIKAEIGALLLRRNPPPRADIEKAANDALALDPDNVEAHRTLGNLYATQVESAPRTASPQQVTQDAKKAAEHLERAIAGTVGTDPQLLFTAGGMYLASGEPQKAVQALARVVQQSPGNARARQMLARAYATNNDLNNAIATLSEVIDFIPQLAPELGLYQEQAGQLKEAAATYTVALAQQPNNRQLKLRRIAVLYNAKDYQQAAALAGEARKQHPDDLNFPRLQARALFDAGDRSGGIAVAESAAKTFPKDLQTQFTLVDLYQDAGRADDAEKTLRQMLAANPSSPQVLNHLGYLLATRGDRLDEAITLVKRALEAEPTNGAYLDSLGWAYFKRGELNDAVKYLSQAAEKLPDNSEIQDHLGDAHARRGALPDAIAAWSKALAGNGQGIDRSVLEKKVQDAKRKLGK